MKKLAKHIVFLIMFIMPLYARATGSAVFADLLVWHASQETSSSWASIISDSGRELDFDATNVNFHWNSGFRGGFQKELGCDFWDTKFYWTYFPSKTSKNFSIANQIVFPEFFSGFLSNNFFFGGNINWRLTLNTIDFELGRKLNLGESITIRPAIGIKGGSIHQKINCNWDAAIYTATETLKNNFSGLGPSFGVDCTWNICNNFNIFGDFATAFMWGNWKVNDKYSRPAALSGLITPTTITTSLNNSKFGTLMFKYRTGLEWIYEGKYRFTFQLAYEMQFWPNQLRLPTFQQLPVHGDLTLQGGTCQILIDF